jgi:hypothetical protein
MTVIFAVLGAGAVASDLARIDLGKRPYLVRAAVTTSYLAAARTLGAGIISHTA